MSQGGEENNQSTDRMTKKIVRERAPVNTSKNLFNSVSHYYIVTKKVPYNIQSVSFSKLILFS